MSVFHDWSSFPGLQDRCLCLRVRHSHHGSPSPPLRALQHRAWACPWFRLPKLVSVCPPDAPAPAPAALTSLSTLFISSLLIWCFVALCSFTLWPIHPHARTLCQGLICLVPFIHIPFLFPRNFPFFFRSLSICSPPSRAP